MVQHVIDELANFPGNRGVIFRRTFPRLNRTVIPLVRQHMGRIGTYNETRHEARFRNGSVLDIATLEHEHDAEAFQGTEYGIVAFEELTEFLESQYSHLLGRLRAPVEGVRPHAIATTNPGGVGHRWVKRRFVAPDVRDLEDPLKPPQPYQVWRPKATAENSTPEFPPLSRCFVPARLEDNTALMSRDPGYRSRLRAQHTRAKRRALELGDWDAIDAVEGALWETTWLEDGRIQSDAVPESRLRVVAVDPSDGLVVDEHGGERKGDAYGLCVASLGTDGHYYVEYSTAWYKPVGELIRETVAVMRDRGADRLVVERNHGGQWLVEAFRSQFPDVKVSTVWASDGKRLRAEPVSVLFEPYDGGPRAHIVGYRHAQLEEQMTTYNGLPREKSPDVLDACVWAITELMTHAPRRGARMRVYLD